MSLQRPPKELARFVETSALHCALNDMAQAYGQQCREAALEEAAIEFDKEARLFIGSVCWTLFELGKRIRNLK